MRYYIRFTSFDNLDECIKHVFLMLCPKFEIDYM